MVARVLCSPVRSQTAIGGTASLQAHSLRSGGTSDEKRTLWQSNYHMPFVSPTFVPFLCGACRLSPILEVFVCRKLHRLLVNSLPRMHSEIAPILPMIGKPRQNTKVKTILIIEELPVVQDYRTIDYP